MQETFYIFVVSWSQSVNGVPYLMNLLNLLRKLSFFVLVLMKDCKHPCMVNTKNFVVYGSFSYFWLLGCILYTITEEELNCFARRSIIRYVIGHLYNHFSALRFLFRNSH